MNSYLMTVQPGGWRFEAEAGTSLLAAAEAAGVILPGSCRNGTCRSCLCRIVEGEIAYLIDWPGLSLDEKRAGDVLPCVAVARSDLVLLAPAARLAGA
ncbi:2Fe-2S iron-sulfur cluster-binding protein [Massilia sp. CCM 8734]|uniref:2Fe-2S iron-sulfur cluster-binding protein n=1 Tax=Massilia sp. CCM 8734 TaxID=2609283 RepID=UPI001422C014|nr:2Fe-2S iron-sulfur cluster-binding protein [Massilia sp. CCM 8734]NHZ95158.1 2Fe-2S iron-sulfur cluster binding domain-containing protein [Massilia sp. CCM 8734]